MSFIIGQLYKRQLQKLKAQPSNTQKKAQLIHPNNNFKTRFWQHLQKFIIQNSFSSKIVHTQHHTIIKLIQLTFTESTSAVFTFRVAPQFQKSMVFIDLFTKNSEFCTIKNKVRRILLNKELLSHLFRAKYILITPHFDFSNGRLSIFIPFSLLFSQSAFVQEDYNLRFYFERTFNLLVNEVGAAAKYISKLLQNDSISSLKGDIESTRITILNKYVQLLTLKKELSHTIIDGPQSKLKQTNTQEFQSMKRIKDNLLSFNCPEFKSVSLFYSKSENAFDLDFSKQIISKEEDAYFSNNINSNIEDNSNNMISIVQATIVLKDPQKIRLVPFRECTNIFIADAQFWYICSGAVGSDGNLMNYDERNIVRKQLLVKKQVAMIKGVRHQKSHRHQKEIVRQMKNSHSLLINRYYEASNVPNIFKDDLLMQFLPFPTLTEYSLLNRHSISLNTKLRFLYFIIQSLRSLQKYNITQMDLKPNNILTHYYNYVRLVDFGQSYHPLVCKNNYKPGFTLPYCAPQIFRNHKTFSIKYDVFALGVIISELIFQKYPYFFYQDATLSTFKTREYLNYWLCCPEEAQCFGERKITTVLWSIVNRCLQEDPENRPEINVLAIIMQLCLEILF